MFGGALGAGLPLQAGFPVFKEWRSIIWKGVNCLGQHAEFYSLQWDPSLCLVPAVGRTLQPFQRALNQKLGSSGACVSFQKSLKDSSSFFFFPPSVILCLFLYFVVMFSGRAGLAEVLGQGNFFQMLKVSTFISRTQSSQNKHTPAYNWNSALAWELW